MNVIKLALGHTVQNTCINLAGRNIFFISQRNKGAYQGYGQTTAEVLNTKNVKVKMIDGYSQGGFRLTDSSFVSGPMIIFRNNIFCWNIGKDEDINEESLEFFFHIHPPIDLLIIGYSNPDKWRNINQTIPIICRKHNITTEILPTEKAVPTYNFLAQIRNVGAAFIPPLNYHFDQTDIIRQKQRLGLDTGLIADEPERIPIIYPTPRPKPKK